MQHRWGRTSLILAAFGVAGIGACGGTEAGAADSGGGAMGCTCEKMAGDCSGTAYGCSPPLDSPSIPSFCARIAAIANGFGVKTVSCGRFVIVFFGVGADCDGAFFYDASTSTPVGTMAACNCFQAGCGQCWFAAGACPAACCFDGSCTTPITEVCPSLDGGTGDAAGDSAGGG